MGQGVGDRPALGTDSWEQEAERFLTWVCLRITCGAYLRRKTNDIQVYSDFDSIGLGLLGKITGNSTDWWRITSELE